MFNYPSKKKVRKQHDWCLKDQKSTVRTLTDKTMLGKQKHVKLH